MRFKLFLLIPGLLLLINIPIKAQNQYLVRTVTDTIPVNLKNHYSLSRVSIIPFSEKIELRGQTLSPKDYKISYKTTSFSLSDSLAYSIFDTLYVTYRSYALSLHKEYKKRSLIIKVNEGGSDTIQVVQNAGGEFTAAEI